MRFIQSLAAKGLSKIVSNEGVMQTACGTPNYVAPEVLLAEGYDKEVDLWAVGVITYILLSGCWPFDADTAPQLYELIISGVYDFPESEWKYISDEGLSPHPPCFELLLMVS